MTPDRSVDHRRVRATLRLCFSAEKADALAARVATRERDPVHALSPIMWLARLNYTTGRWLALVIPGRRSDRVSPLYPHPGLPAFPALALALHLGLGLDVGTLARLFRVGTSDVAAALQRARQTVDREHLSACPDFAVQIGRYRDPVADRVLRLELLQHLEGCERCRLTHERARDIDQELIAAIDQYEREVGPVSAESRRAHSLWLGPVLVWGSVALVLLLVAVMALAGSHRILSGNQKPVPLIAPHTASSSVSGWLLEANQGGDVEAVDLASGNRRALIVGEPPRGVTSSSFIALLSPDKSTIAQVSQGSNGSDRTYVRVFRIDGTLLTDWELLNAGGVSTVLDWLNSDELLISQLPQRLSGEPIEHYDSRLVSDGKLAGLSVGSGQRRVIATGWITDARPSPDGRYLALLRRDTTSSTALEIDPFDGTQVSDPVASTPFSDFQPSGSNFLWTPDSRRVIFGTRDSVLQTDIFESLTVDGTLKPFYSLPNAGFVSMIGLSPDGAHLVLVASVGGISSESWSYLDIEIDGGGPIQLTGVGVPMSISIRALFSQPLTVVAAPSGDVMALSMVQAFEMPQPSETGPSPAFPTYVTLGFNSDGRLVGPLQNQFSGASLIGWLPESALPPILSSTPVRTGNFREMPLPVQRMDEGAELTGYSQVSPNGSRVLFYDRYYDLAMSVPATHTATMQVAGPPFDASWLPDSSAVIGVIHHRRDDGFSTAIGIWGTTGFNSSTTLSFDPAGIGQKTFAAYHAPMLSPDGLHYSFFVVENQIVSLWIGGYDHAPLNVASWTVPDDARIDQPYIAAWVDNQTFIFSQPDNWSGGLPQRVSLQRLTIGADDSARIDTLLTWHPHGNEKGIALQELLLSPDHAQIAVRLRHYTGSDPSHDRFDSIAVISSADLTQSLELARGSAGDGLSWSPDSSELVAVIKGRLQVMSSDGHDVRQIDTGNQDVSYPLWVQRDEIWYEVNDQGKAVQINYAIR